MSTFELDGSEADSALVDFEKALFLLHPRNACPDRIKALAVFSDNIGLLFFSEIDLGAAGGADGPLKGRLKPTQVLLDWVGAMRAGKANFDVEKANGSI